MTVLLLPIFIEKIEDLRIEDSLFNFSVKIFKSLKPFQLN